jgi:hypothetical protein
MYVLVKSNTKKPRRKFSSEWLPVNPEFGNILGRDFKCFGMRRQWIWAGGEAERLEVRAALANPRSGL